MNDEERKMLECAAKAGSVAMMEDAHLHNKGDGLMTLTGEIWNPLTEDGDAFRLAAHLKMLVDFDSGIADVEGFEPVSDSDIKRAITLAAARLGGYEG